MVQEIEGEYGTAFLDPTLGISWATLNRPDGFDANDLIDVHEIVGDEAKDFKEKYFLLLPTWYFLRVITKEILLKRIGVI
jgi:hypothetical protein